MSVNVNDSFISKKIRKRNRTLKQLINEADFNSSKESISVDNKKEGIKYDEYESKDLTEISQTNRGLNEVLLEKKNV